MYDRKLVFYDKKKIRYKFQPCGEVIKATVVCKKSRRNVVMRRISDLLGSEMSVKASKAATDALWQTGNGVSAYCLGGKIFVGCGIVWLLISFIPIVCKNPMREWLWMWILAALQIILGILLIILSKKSKRFQTWADKDFKKGLEKKKKLEDKVKIGKVKMPITNGDVLALKICGLFILMLVVILGIGYLQGWVV